MPALASLQHRTGAQFAAQDVRLRRNVAVLLGACLVGSWGASASAQKNVSTKSTTEVLQSEGDDYPIHITYYEAPDNAGGRENAPVLVMLHGEGGSRLIYDKSSAPPDGRPLAEFMNNTGYAVVTVDLRKHGESLEGGASRILNNKDFYKMAYGDLPAVKKFLIQQHEAKKLNVNKLGIIASDATVPVALEFAMLDWQQVPYLDAPGGKPGTPRGQDVRAIVMLSPEVSVGRVNGSRTANFLKNPRFEIAFMIAAGTRDPDDRGAAQKLHQIVSSPRQNEGRVEYFRPNTNARGTDLLGNPAAQPEKPIDLFLAEHVLNLDSEWRTRKSRYDRDAAAE